ncbi:MAG: cobalamin B12-binding domain-containing protein [Elusimicrobia bacterium]|nr:cobalamin B12-binding domain-containing protein [Elusimicrobiota bacterium]
MKVLLVNSNTVRPPVSPIGLLYLSAYLKRKGVDVQVADLCMEKERESLWTRWRLDEKDLIGVSIRNIDSTQMKLNQYFLPETLSIIQDIRRRYPRTPIVLGGAGYSLAPAEILRVSLADFGIVGEGETSLYALVRALESMGDTREIPGLVYRTDSGGCRINPPSKTGAAFLEELPFQDIDAVDYPAYYNEGGMASVQTKRGCAMTCAYCTYPLIEGRSFRLIEPRRVVDEMEHLVSRGFDYFHFTDSVFNVPRAHALEICKEIARRSLPVRWHTYMSPQGFDDELLESLIRAGNDGILFGVDSCSDRMLMELGKDFRKVDIYRAARLCHERDMEFSFHILFGAPGETMETAQETLDALDELHPTAAFLTQGIRVYHNTATSRRLVREGRLSPEKSLLEPCHYLSEALPPNFSEVLHGYALSRDFVFSDTTVKSPSTNEDIVHLYQRNFRGPCWKVLREFKKVSAQAK